MEPIVSVIIPCYNSEKYLKDTIDSVLHQSLSSIELICVDNGSTDKTISLIEEMMQEDHRIVLFHQSVKGAPAARNLGVVHAKGKYLQFLDSDDLITREKLELQVTYLENNDVDLVVSDRSVYNEKMDHLISRHTFGNILKNPLETTVSQIIITGNPLYKKKSFMNSGLWDESLRSAQDWELHIRLALLKYRFGYLAGNFLKSRSHNKSLSADWISVTEDGIMVLKKYRNQLISANVTKDYMISQKIFFCYFDLAIHQNNPDFFYQGMKDWNIPYTPFFRGKNKIIKSLFGINFLIRFKSFLLRKRKGVN